MLHWRHLLQAAAQTVVILALTLPSAIPPSGVAASRPLDQTAPTGTATSAPSATAALTETVLPPLAPGTSARLRYAFR